MLLIALTLYVLLMFQFLLIAISMVLQSIFLIKTSILVFTIASGCLMWSKKYKINLLAKLISSNFDNMNILSFFFVFLHSFNFFRKQKNDLRLKIIFTHIAFLVCILYRFSKPQNRLSCFNCQFLPMTPSK